ncbi:jg5042 [Pararge aegeria aegeria]|uniref:Jg5042 protein n=1 Tax=Pararge aegeria aegeria TaxID=348720 RepID=A0A8S4SHL9_9NEOP|nr:jg5042 [Pararge aegeria aegeria]
MIAVKLRRRGVAVARRRRSPVAVRIMVIFIDVLLNDHLILLQYQEQLANESVGESKPARAGGGTIPTRRQNDAGGCEPPAGPLLASMYTRVHHYGTINIYLY